MSELLRAVPPDVWVALAGAVGGLVLQALNARGYKLPFLRRQLDSVAPDVPAPKPEPTPEPVIGDGKLLKELLDYLRRRDVEKSEK